MVQWTKEQQDAIYSKGSNILVAAAAGSGKTAVLVERIIQKLLDQEEPLNIDEILVATFTNAAAEEMRNRITEALEQAIKEDPSSYHLKKQLSLIQRSSISTLHSFCTSVVRQHAYLLDIDPAFRIADEMEIDLIKQEVVDDMFEDAYSFEGEKLEQFFTVVDMFSSDRSDIDVENLILSLYTFAMQHPFPDKWLEDVVEVYHIGEKISEQDLTWLNILKEEIREQFLAFRSELKNALHLTEMSDGPYHYAEALLTDIQLIDGAMQHIDDWDELQQFIVTSKLKSLSRKRVECDEDKKEQIKQIRGRFRDQWNKMAKEWFARNLTGHMEDLRTLYPAIKLIAQLVLDFKVRFDTKKRERAIVDFADLEHFCLAILRDEQSTPEQFIPSPIANYYKNQFKEVLVDEYQDINYVQETILRTVSDQDGPGNMFMVGDVKQSIYRFRHAEPSLFIEKYNTYAQNSSDGKRIDLARNFRSREAILNGANFIFKQIFDETVGDIDYDEKAELIYGNVSYDDIPIMEPEIEVVVIDKEGEDDQRQEEVDLEDEERVEDLLTVQMEARLYAEKIKQWIGNKSQKAMQVYDKDNKQMRNIQYRDIVILLRSLTGLSTIMDELKKQGIPVYVEMKTGYFSAIEIQVMINMLKIIDNPYQDVPLASVLRSPIVDLNEEHLANIRLMNRHEPFYEALKLYSKADEEYSERVQTFLLQLDYFRNIAKEGALSDLIWKIYQETGYYDFVGGIPGGRQRQANLRALYDRARGYEASSFRGLFRFLRFIERMQEQKKDLGEARALSEQEDVVRIMTIHKSKGLEFPVVIMGGMHKEFNFTDLRRKYMLDKDLGFATKFINPEKRITYSTLYYLAMKEVSLRHLLSEEMRVLYVAMTRAKEKLMMIGTVTNFSNELESKWSQVANHQQWLIPKHFRKRAKTYYDWIIPALIRHDENKQLQLENDLDSRIPIGIKSDRSKWKIEILPGSALTNLEEEKLVSKKEVKEIITKWDGVASEFLDKSIFSDVDEKLLFEYQFVEAAQTRAKQSVTEIKRRQEIADQYSSDQLITPFKAPLVKRPNFLQIDQALSAAEIGTAMHTVMQHIPLTKMWKKEEIKTFVDRLVEKELLTEQEGKVIDLKAIETFFMQDIASKLIGENRIEREVPFTYTLDASEVYTDWKSNLEEKVLIQGVIDCLIYAEDKIIILDYKTDAIVEKEITEQLINELKERYRVQMSLYKRAMGDILGETVEDAYLYFFAKNLLIRL